MIDRVIELLEQSLDPTFAHNARALNQEYWKSMLLTFQTDLLSLLMGLSESKINQKSLFDDKPNI